MDADNTVLIVDDETEICVLLSSILKRKNKRPYYVHTIAAAKEAIDTKKPELIFLDINLPDGNGFDLFTQLRREHPEIRIIIISAFDIYKGLALKKGAYDFLPKPFSREDVIEILQDAS